MRLDVLPIGDGACSVLSHSCSPDVAVVDCGDRSRTSDEAAAQLTKFLGSRQAFIRQLVVTHFDADHWRGLVHLAQYQQYWVMKESASSSITLYYPNLPSPRGDLLPTILAVVSLNPKSPVRATALFDAWKRTGYLKATVGLNQGDVVELAGRPWNVLWPPLHIERKSEKRISQLIDDVKALADEFADSGYPALRNALRDAYRWWEGEDSKDTDPAPDDAAPLIPAARAEAFRKLANRVRRLNNYYSLVLEEDTGQVINFGDTEKGALKTIVSSQATRSHYPVMLAPHHGTVKVPTGFARADWCVAQGGVKSKDHFVNHQLTHGCSQFIDTLRASVVSFEWPDS